LSTPYLSPLTLYYLQGKRGRGEGEEGEGGGRGRKGEEGGGRGRGGGGGRGEGKGYNIGNHTGFLDHSLLLVILNHS
jgi:hypothetical protein